MSNKTTDRSRFLPSQEEPVNIKDILARRNVQVAIGVVVGLIALIFILGAINGNDDDEQAYEDFSSSVQQQEENKTPERYLALLEEDGPHTFHSDDAAVSFGLNVCNLLDEYYMEDIEEEIAFSNIGATRGASLESKGAGIVAAAVVICPEHLEEVQEWLNN